MKNVLSNQSGSTLLSPLVAGSLFLITIWATGRGIAQNVKLHTAFRHSDLYQQVEKDIQSTVMTRMNNFTADASIANPPCQNSSAPFSNVFNNVVTSMGLNLNLAGTSELQSIPANLVESYNGAISRCVGNNMLPNLTDFSNESPVHFCLMMTAPPSISSTPILAEFQYTRRDIKSLQIFSCADAYKTMEHTESKLEYTLYWVNPDGVHQMPGSYMSRGYNPTSGQNSIDNVGLMDPESRRFYLNFKASEGAFKVITLSSPSSAAAFPITGDWDGDGYDGVGYFNEGTFYLKNQLSDGEPEHQFSFPNTNGFLPISGSWTDTSLGVGLYDPAAKTFYLKTSLSGGNWDYHFVVPNAPDDGLPFSGRFSSSGEGVGVYSKQNGSFCIVSDLSQPVCTLTASLVVGNAVSPITGNWFGDGRSRLALFDGSLSEWHFWYDYSAEISKRNFGPSPTSMRPFAGKWERR